MSAKLDLKKYEKKLDFLKSELYVKREQLNQVFLDAGRVSMFHNFLFESQTGITEQYPDALLDVSHKVVVLCDVNGDLTIQGRLRTMNEELNGLLKEASRLGIRLDLSQNVLYLDELPQDESEDYNGRWALVLEIIAPNLDDMLKEADAEE